MTGFSRATVSAYEADSSSPDADFLVQLSKHGFDVMLILLGEHRADFVQKDIQWDGLVRLIRMIYRAANQQDCVLAEEVEVHLLENLYLRLRNGDPPSQTDVSQAVAPVLLQMQSSLRSGTSPRASRSIR